MELLIKKVLWALQGAGYRAAWAAPGADMPRITGPVLAVGLESATWPAGTGTLCLAVDVFTPRAGGGPLCNQVAAAVAQGLSEGLEGLPSAVCTAGAAAYYAPGDYFRARVLARFPLAHQKLVFLDRAQLLVGGQAQAGAWTCTEKLRQELEPAYSFGQAEPAALCVGRRQYGLRLELPPTAGALEELAEFTVELRDDGQSVLYTGCRWTAFERTWNGDGRVQAEAAAVKREVRSL